MKYLEFIARRASELTAILLAFSVAACGARTGPWIPDTRALAPPLCSRTTGTVHFSLSPDPITPSLLMARTTRVEWLFGRRCATDLPTDPSQGIGGRQSDFCTITQYIPSYQDLQYGGGCNDLSRADWHTDLGSSIAQPSSIGFDFVGEIQGNVCVHGTVHFSNGSTSPLPTRLWRVQLDAPVSNPPIGFFMGIDTAGVDPTFSQLSSSSPECPET